MIIAIENNELNIISGGDGMCFIKPLFASTNMYKQMIFSGLSGQAPYILHNFQKTCPHSIEIDIDIIATIYGATDDASMRDFCCNHKHATDYIFDKINFYTGQCQIALRHC